MTENAGMTITRKSDPQEKVFTTDGRALPGTEMRVVDDDKRPLPADTVGNLQARGHHALRRLPQEAAAQLDRRGRLVRHRRPRAQDKDGYIRIVGRTKDVIIRGGENIPVAEVENLHLPPSRQSPSARWWRCPMRGSASARAPTWWPRPASRSTCRG